LTQLGDDAASLMEFRFREFRFACEVMQVTHCRRHDFAESRVMGAT